MDKLTKGQQIMGILYVGFMEILDSADLAIMLNQLIYKQNIALKTTFEGHQYFQVSLEELAPYLSDRTRRNQMQRLIATGFIRKRKSRGASFYFVENEKIEECLRNRASIQPKNNTNISQKPSINSSKTLEAIAQEVLTTLYPNRQLLPEDRQLLPIKPETVTGHSTNNIIINNILIYINTNDDIQNSLSCGQVTAETWRILYKKLFDKTCQRRKDCDSKINRMSPERISRLTLYTIMDCITLWDVKIFTFPERMPKNAMTFLNLFARNFTNEEEYNEYLFGNNWPALVSRLEDSQSGKGFGVFNDWAEDNLGIKFEAKEKVNGTKTSSISSDALNTMRETAYR